jgi:hypothetical protein
VIFHRQIEVVHKASISMFRLGLSLRIAQSEAGIEHTLMTVRARLMLLWASVSGFPR